MRLQFPREFYIPKSGTTKVTEKSGLAVVYIYTSARNRPAAVAFIGKALKPAWHHTFSTEAQREKHIRDLFARLNAHRARVAEHRKESNAGHTLVVGDIVSNSWGYDQTNVDWYRVVRVSRVYVWLQRIHGHTSGGAGSSMAGYSTPYADTSSANPSEWTLVDSDKHPVEKRKAHGSNVCMDHGSASKWDGKPRYESWYA